MTDNLTNDTLRCLRCGSANVSVSVNVCLRIHPKYFFRLTKRAIATKDVELQSADWPNARMVCRDCGWFVIGKTKLTAKVESCGDKKLFVEDTDGNKIIVIMEDDTIIEFKWGFSILEKGSTVEIEYNGLVIETLPAQIYADRVKLL